MKDLDCDFYLLAGHKWIMGPEGATAVCIKEELISQIDPPVAGVGTQSSFNFAENTMEYRPGALRYEYGGRHLSLYFAVDSAIIDIIIAAITTISKKAEPLWRGLLSFGGGVKRNSSSRLLSIFNSFSAHAREIQIQIYQIKQL